MVICGPIRMITSMNFSQSATCSDEPTQGILDITAKGIFLYKSPNQAYQFLEEKVLFKQDWSTKSQNDHHQEFSLKEEMNEIRMNYNNRYVNNASKNHQNNGTPMCERLEGNYIQSEELNNDVKNNLEDFKGCIRSMRTVHWKLFARDDGKTTGVLLNKKSKTVNQEPRPKTDLEKSITKLLDGQRVTNICYIVLSFGLSPYSSPLPQIPSPPLPISSPPPISPTYVEGSLGSRATGIRQRDAPPVHETEIPEMWLPLRKRLCRTTPGPRCEDN
ncbi:hypothetical protein Tco_0777631 [Tanacetum coccineum]